MCWLNKTSESWQFCYTVQKQINVPWVLNCVSRALHMQKIHSFKKTLSEQRLKRNINIYLYAWTENVYQKFIYVQREMIYYLWKLFWKISLCIFIFSYALLKGNALLKTLYFVQKVISLYLFLSHQKLWKNPMFRFNPIIFSILKQAHLAQNYSKYI